MKLQVHSLSLPIPSGDAPKGFGWSDVLVHFKDVETEMGPSVTIKVHVPCNASDTVQIIRELALTRAREVLKAASLLMDAVEVADFDKEDRF
jgi:hypothetical protein